MSATRLQSRRYSLPSLGSSKECDASSGKENSSTGVQAERKRKLNDSDEPSSDAKRSAISITDIVGNLQEAVTKEQLEESICCLPGGELRVMGVKPGLRELDCMYCGLYLVACI